MGIAVGDGFAVGAGVGRTAFVGELAGVLTAMGIGGAVAGVLLWQAAINKQVKNNIFPRMTLADNRSIKDVFYLRCFNKQKQFV